MFDTQTKYYSVVKMGFLDTKMIPDSIIKFFQKMGNTEYVTKLEQNVKYIRDTNYYKTHMAAKETYYEKIMAKIL